MQHGTPMWIFFIPLVIVAIGYLIAASRKGSVRSASLGSRRSELHSAADPQTVFDRISTIGGKFRVDDRDPTAKILVVSSPITFGTWGFLYPIFVHADGAGSRVEIGCHLKFIQMGPLVTRWHRQCVAAVEALLAPPVARVA